MNREPSMSKRNLPPNSDEYWLDAEKEIINTNEPLFAFEPGLTGHQWRQQGPYIVCKSCELVHALRIGMNKQLIGIDEEGMPILKSVER